MNSFVVFISVVASLTTILGMCEVLIQRQSLKEPRATGIVSEQNVLCLHIDDKPRSVQI